MANPELSQRIQELPDKLSGLRPNQGLPNVYDGSTR